MEKQFVDFMETGGLQDLTSEFLIPTEIGCMLADGIKVTVIPVSAKWFGMTFFEEAAMVQTSLKGMTEEGL